jgi:threonine aldolase
MGYKGISDFRSDTVTRPTEAMRKAMFDAEVGDDVHGDDPTVLKLESLAAEKIEKEAALFVPSGTMGNTIAMILAAGEGKVVLLEEKCHIFNFESGNISRIARSLPRTLPSNRGKIPLDVLEANIPGDALREHIPEVRAIALENTHNIWGGAVLDIDYMKRVYTLAKKHRLHLHLDGARIFNAATALKVAAKEISRNCDSVMFCLSKGLSAPIGSILAGSRDFITEARKIRKYLGGGMRQVGVIAAAGIVSLEEMIGRLEDDHLRAKKLAESISDIDAIEVQPDQTVTNFVMIRLKHMDATTFLDKCSREKVLALPYTDRLIRFVTHKDIDDQDIENAIKTIHTIFLKQSND